MPASRHASRESESRYDFNSGIRETPGIREARRPREEGEGSIVGTHGIFDALRFRRDEYLAAVLENVKTPRRRATVRRR